MRVLSIVAVCALSWAQVLYCNILAKQQFRVSHFAADGNVAIQDLTPRQQPRDVRPALKIGTARLTGVVMSDETPSRPLKRVNIAILGTDDAQIRLTMTDDAGRFVMPALAAGHYLITASKQPYVDTVYGARLPGRPGTPIVLKEGEQRTDVVLKMMRGGVITGTVSDENGQPAVGVSVEIMQPARRSGDQMLMSVVSTISSVLLPRLTTDDRGAYRFSGLPPGEYVVSATPVDLAGGDAVLLTPDDIQSATRESVDSARPAPKPAPTGPPSSTVINPEDRPQRPMQMSGMGPAFMNFPSIGMAGGPGIGSSGPTIGYAPVYYPGTTSAAEALAIAIGPGDERIDINITARPVPTTRIDGVVFGPDGQPAPNITIQVRAEDNVETLVMLMTAFGRSVSTRPDGAFTLTGIAPGRYTLHARRMNFGARGGGAPQPPSEALWAAAEIVADGRPITGLSLTLQPGLTLSGRAAFDAASSATAPEITNVTVTATPSRIADIASLSAGSARVQADGSFTLTGLTPGTYRLNGMVSGQGPMPVWMDTSVVVGGREVSDLPFELRPGSNTTDALVTLSNRQQGLSGTLQEASGRPATEYTMVLFPADKTYWFAGTRRILTARPATDGRFEFRGILGPPAGAYLLAAVTDIRPNEQFDPVFLAQLAKESIKVTIGPGEMKTQDVQLVK